MMREHFGALDSGSSHGSMLAFVLFTDSILARLDSALTAVVQLCCWGRWRYRTSSHPDCTMDVSAECLRSVFCQG